MLSLKLVIPVSYEFHYGFQLFKSLPLEKYCQSGLMDRIVIKKSLKYKRQGTWVNNVY